MKIFSFGTIETGNEMCYNTSEPRYLKNNKRKRAMLYAENEDYLHHRSGF